MLAVTKLATDQNTATDTASVVIELDVVGCPQDHPRVTSLELFWFSQRGICDITIAF